MGWTNEKQFQSIDLASIWAALTGGGSGSNNLDTLNKRLYSDAEHTPSVFKFGGNNKSVFVDTQDESVFQDANTFSVFKRHSDGSSVFRVFDGMGNEYTITELIGNLLTGNGVGIGELITKCLFLDNTADYPLTVTNKVLYNSISSPANNGAVTTAIQADITTINGTGGKVTKISQSTTMDAGGNVLGVSWLIEYVSP